MSLPLLGGQIYKNSRRSSPDGFSTSSTDKEERTQSKILFSENQKAAEVQEARLLI